MKLRTYKFKSPEWFNDPVVKVVVRELDSGAITVTVHDPKHLVNYIEHLKGEEADDLD